MFTIKGNAIDLFSFSVSIFLQISVKQSSIHTFYVRGRVDDTFEHLQLLSSYTQSHSAWYNTQEEFRVNVCALSEIFNIQDI